DARHRAGVGQRAHDDRGPRGVLRRAGRHADGCGPRLDGEQEGPLMIWFPGTSVTKGAISIPARAAKPEPEPEMVEVVEVIYLGEGWAEWVFTHEVGDQPSLDISDYWGLQLRTPDQGWISPVSFDEIADNVAYMIYDVHEKPDAARVVAHPEGGFFAIPFVNGLQLKVDVPCTFI